MASGVVAVGVAGLVFGFILPGRAGGWAGGVFLLCWLIVMVWMFFPVRLVCPACSNDVERGELGPYCPTCGSRSLSAGGRWKAPRCAACGKRLRRGRYRYYKVRACTHCGLLLDERGL
jgi:DNA-directed RNA polymerase subunit RPC12/RpoP